MILEAILAVAGLKYILKDVHIVEGSEPDEYSAYFNQFPKK